MFHHMKQCSWLRSISQKYFTIFSKFFEQETDKVGNKHGCNLTCVYSLSYVSLQTRLPSRLAPGNLQESYPTTVRPKRVLCQVIDCVYFFISNSSLSCLNFS